jgi:hypothetical protein
MVPPEDVFGAFGLGLRVGKLCRDSAGLLLPTSSPGRFATSAVTCGPFWKTWTSGLPVDAFTGVFVEPTPFTDPFDNAEDDEVRGLFVTVCDSISSSVVLCRSSATCSSK